MKVVVLLLILVALSMATKTHFIKHAKVNSEQKQATHKKEVVPSAKKEKHDAQNCIWEWNCQELEELVNTPCNQTDQNEYIECVVKYIDSEIADCSAKALEPAGWGSGTEDASV